MHSVLLRCQCALRKPHTGKHGHSYASTPQQLERTCRCRGRSCRFNASGEACVYPGALSVGNAGFMDHQGTMTETMFRQGKTRHIGVSEVSSATLRRAHAVLPSACVQMEYSAFSTEIESPEHNLFATCRELGVASWRTLPCPVVCWAGVSRGRTTLGRVTSEGSTRAFRGRISPRIWSLSGPSRNLQPRKA